MAIDHPDRDSRYNFTPKHNPNGPWANFPDPLVRIILLSSAGKYHRLCTPDNPKLEKFEDFLDMYTLEWQKHKERVEEEARKYGFVSSDTTAEIPQQDRHKAAVLALTIMGSFLLLGNGCLTHAGGSGQYEKIVFRKGEGMQKRCAPEGVSCLPDAVRGQALYLRNLVMDVEHTSPLHALYYTLKQLPPDDALALGNALSRYTKLFAHTVLTGKGDRETEKEPRKKENAPLPEVPEPVM